MSNQPINFGYAMLKEAVTAIPQWDAFLRQKAEELQKQAKSLSASLIEPVEEHLDEPIIAQPRSSDHHDKHPSATTSEPADESTEGSDKKPPVVKPEAKSESDKSDEVLVSEAEKKDVSEIATGVTGANPKPSPPWQASPAPTEAGNK